MTNESGSVFPSSVAYVYLNLNIIAIITCHTASVFYAAVCRMTRQIIKAANPIRKSGWRLQLVYSISDKQVNKIYSTRSDTGLWVS